MYVVCWLEQQLRPVELAFFIPAVKTRLTSTGEVKGIENDLLFGGQWRLFQQKTVDVQTAFGKTKDGG